MIRISHGEAKWFYAVPDREVRDLIELQGLLNAL
jgi:hypothetical protein